MRKGFCKYLFFLSVISVLSIAVILFGILNLQPRHGHQDIFSFKQRIPQLGLNFSLEYNLTGGLRPRQHNIREI